MKIKYLILLFSLLYLCSCLMLQKRNNTNQNVKVLNIDKEVLKDGYLIKCLEYSSNDIILTLLPRSENMENIKKGKSYYFTLKPLSIFIEEGDEAGIVLSINDVYLEGVLVFSAGVNVYKVLSWNN